MKKRILAFLLVFSCLLALCPVFGISHTEVQAAEGIPDILLYEDYSSSKEFRISTAPGLKKFSELGQTRDFKGITFYLVADIDMSGVAYTPVPYFHGTFDGGYHVIERLSISTTNNYCGLFGITYEDSIIRRLGIEGGTFTVTTNSADYRVGSFAGVVRGLVEECWSSAVLTGVASGTTKDISVGGIAGALLNGGIVRNSYFAGRAVGVDHCAGIADWCQGQYENHVGQIINCFNIGTLSATTCYALGRYSGSILAAHKTNAILNSYYFDNYTTYNWATGAKKVSKAWLGSGYLAYLMNQNAGSPIWSKGAMFPELRGEGGVYPLSVTYNNKGYKSTATMYYNVGDTYTAHVSGTSSIALSSPAGSISGNVFTMPAQSTSLTVTIDLPNIAQYTTYPNESVYVITNAAGFTAMATAVNGGKTLSGKIIYMLGDIDLNNATHTPIGQFVSDSSWTKSFSGKLFGNNFKIFNLKVNNTSLNGGGLFGSCYKATFRGVHVFNGSVTCANRAGGITGYADGGCSFSHCSNGADIKTTTGKDGAAGLAGVARGGASFQYCANYGSVTATVDAAAGIAGWGQTNIKLTGCINTGIITAPSDYAALARVGSGYSGTWTQCNYLKSACSTSYSGSSRDENYFSTGIIGGSINTNSRTTENNSAFTNTPRFPAICTENDAPATCCQVRAYDNGVSIGTITVYANVGDKVAMTTVQDYYSETGYTVTADLSGNSYPQAIFYPINCNLNGGTFTEEATARYSFAPGAPLPLDTQVSKDGYHFAGWYENSGLTGQPVAVVSPYTRGDKTYYAKWSAVVEIGTVAEYLAFAQAVNAGNTYSDKVVSITADLDFGGQTIPAIGTAKAPFCGVLDGNGHVLSNFTISGSDSQGLVGYLKQGTVQYVKVENATVSGKTNVGTVVGYNDSGLILGCESTGTVVNTGTIYDLSYMSFNIRCGEDPSPNTVSERTPRVKTYLANYQPDIIGLQEVTPTWKSVLSTALSGYSSEFKYRDSAGNEAAPLYWKTSKFNVLEQGTFWLSETPDKMSYGWGATYYRTCSYAILQPKNTNVIILAYNTHLDHKSTQAQIEGIKLIRSRMDTMEKKYRDKGYTEIYSFVTGDFNAKPTADAGKYLSNNSMIEARNAAVSLGTPLNQNTFSAYNATPTSIIDYIFVSRNVDVKTYKVTLDKVNGNAVSDHYGLYGTMRLGGNSQGGIVGMNKGYVQSSGFAGSIDTKAGCGGIAGYNTGKIIGCYSQFTPKVSDVFTNGIAGKIEGSVSFSYYPSGVGLSGNGNTTADMTNSSYLKNLNRPLKLWSMDVAVNDGLPFICLQHEFVYADMGDGTHKGTCSYCGSTVTENHTAVTVDGVAPSCTEAGKTAGSNCGVCNAVLTAQEAVPATGHSYKAEIAMSPSCTDTGLKIYACENCTHSYTETIPAAGHVVVIDKAIPATCLSSGLTEGSHCETCNTVLVPQVTQPRLGHDPILKDNGDGTHTEGCSRCTRAVTSKHSYTNGVCVCGAKDSVEEATWKLGHSLNLASDISVNYAIARSALTDYDIDSVYVLAEIDTYKDGTPGTKEVKLLPVENGSYYYFILEGMTAVNMNDEIRAVLYGTKNGQVHYSPIDTYSVATYAYAQLDKSAASAKLKTLCAELLRYGSHAQIFKSYRLDALVDSKMTAEHKALLSDPEAVTFGNTNLTENVPSFNSVTWLGKSLDLASKVSVKFIFSLGSYTGSTEDLTMKVSYQNINGTSKEVIISEIEVYNPDRGYYAFTLDSLLAAELRSVLTVQILSGETVVSGTLQYAADTYGNGKTGTLGDLCKALFAYSDSAKAYFAN